MMPVFLLLFRSKNCTDISPLVPPPPPRVLSAEANAWIRLVVRDSIRESISGGSSMHGSVIGKAVFELDDELGAGLGVKRDGRTEGK